MRAPLRRGICPGLSAPLSTGDGLLVRFMPAGTMTLAVFTELCVAARRHGNGVIEVTSRGSIQVRGLTAASALHFGEAMGALGIAADGIPVLTGPLSGLDADEILDATALAGDLRHTLARTTLAAELAPKISVVIDGGGMLSLDAIAADVRLCAATSDRGTVLRVDLGGNAASATHLGCVAPTAAVETVMRLLGFIARRGRDVRARDVLAAEGVEPLRSALAIAPCSFGCSLGNGANATREAIGVHRLRDGSVACGIGLGFGHADAAALERLAEAAVAAGARGIRAAVGRVLMIIGLAPETAPTFAAAAESLGCIARADDPRRRVIACAGAPICSSAYIAARRLAPHVAAAIGSGIDGAATIHISGCAKGCAHPMPAALTIVGTADGCALVRNGSAHDAPFAIIAAHDLAAAVADHMGAVRAFDREATHA